MRVTAQFEARCGKGYAEEKRCAVPGADFPGNCGPVPGVPPRFTFPGGPHAQVAATWSVGCALSSAGELSCRRRDGAVVPTPNGRYTFIDAGSKTLCAIRCDGTSACWQHDGLAPGDAPHLDITRFDPVTPAIDPDW